MAGSTSWIDKLKASEKINDARFDGENVVASKGYTWQSCKAKLTKDGKVVQLFSDWTAISWVVAIVGSFPVAALIIYFYTSSKAKDRLGDLLDGINGATGTKYSLDDFEKGGLGKYGYYPKKTA